MAHGKKIAPHETFELHELLTFKNVCATKSAAMAELVKNEALKNMLEQDFSMAQQQIRELQNLIQTSEYATGYASMNMKGTLS
jgi:similar to spore coat protein